MTPGAQVLVLGHGHISPILKIHYFFKNHFLFSQASWIRQTKYRIIMTKVGSTKNIYFMTPGAEVLVLGHGHLIHLVKMHYFFNNLLLYFSIQGHG